MIKNKKQKIREDIEYPKRKKSHDPVQKEKNVKYESFHKNQRELI
jgi:hypothetical protein